jgi:hypothetical protein
MSLIGDMRMNVKFAEGACKMDDIQKIADDIIYLNYRFNRDRSPDISPERWKAIYGDKVNKFEVWYQADTILGSAGLCL